MGSGPGPQTLGERQYELSSSTRSSGWIYPTAEVVRVTGPASSSTTSSSQHRRNRRHRQKVRSTEEEMMRNYRPEMCGSRNFNHGNNSEIIGF